MTLLRIIAGLLWCGAALAQTAPSAEDETFLQSERERIAQARRHEEGSFAQQEAGCYQRFAVNDCLREVRVRRRAALEDLRRQEIVINDIERKRRGAEQIRHQEEKNSLRAQQEEAERRAAAQQDHQERQERAQRKQAERAADQAAVPPRQGASQPASGVDRAAEKQRYEDKLRQAQEHKAERAKAQADKASPPARPLPVAP